MRRGIAVALLALLYTVGAGAEEPLDWTLRWSEGWSDPLFEPRDETWVEHEFDSMLGEVRAYADPAGGGGEGESEVRSKECIALREDVFAEFSGAADADLAQEPLGVVRVLCAQQRP